MSLLAPVILFVFARPEHTLRTLKALAENECAAQTDLIVYADAARNAVEVDRVEEVRRIVRAITGFRCVHIIERTVNFGLARNVIEGVAETLRRHERVIVLEDDMETSPYFLSYMNEALEKYVEDERVASIHGYVYPVTQGLPEAFFLRGADCWGWATWRRGWACFKPDGAHLLGELRRRKLLRAFDFNGTYPYSAMLRDQVEGRNNSWAIRWYASAFLADKLTLYPGRSLVHNMGNDDSGTHCGRTNAHDVRVSPTPIDLKGVEVCPSAEGLRAFEDFFRKTRGGWMRRLVRRVWSMLRR